MSTLVLLRGLMREARHWGDFPQLLGEAVPQASTPSTCPATAGCTASPAPRAWRR
jgi:hypothetical protein